MFFLSGSRRVRRGLSFWCPMRCDVNVVLLLTRNGLVVEACNSSFGALHEQGIAAKEQLSTSFLSFVAHTRAAVRLLYPACEDLIFEIVIDCEQLPNGDISPGPAKVVVEPNEDDQRVPAFKFHVPQPKEFWQSFVDELSECIKEDIAECRRLHPELFTPEREYYHEGVE